MIDLQRLCGGADCKGWLLHPFRLSGWSGATNGAAALLLVGEDPAYAEVPEEGRRVLAALAGEPPPVPTSTLDVDRLKAVIEADVKRCWVCEGSEREDCIHCGTPDALACGHCAGALVVLHGLAFKRKLLQRFLRDVGGSAVVQVGPWPMTDGSAVFQKDGVAIFGAGWRLAIMPMRRASAEALEGALHWPLETTE